MNSPLALLAVASPTPSGPASGPSAPDARGSGDSLDSGSFARVMARQRAGQDAAASTPSAASSSSAASSADGKAAQAGNAATPPKDAAGGKDGAAADAGEKDDGKTAADAAADAAAPSLAQQALAMAALAAQLPGGPAVAGAPESTAVSPDIQDAGAAPAAAIGATPAGAGAAAADTAGLPASTVAAGDAAIQAGANGIPATAPANANTDMAASTPASAAPASARDAAPPPAALRDRETLRGADAADAMNTALREGDAGVRGQHEAPRLAADAANAAAAKDDAAAIDPAAARNGAPGAHADAAQALAAAWQAPTAANGSQPVAGSVRTPVGQPQWGAELGGQLVLMTHRAVNDTHTAELRLDPPDLGPLRVTIKLSDGIAEASFVSAHAAVRQAVESALPQLQQTLAQAGISLGHTNVSDQGAQAGFGGMQQGNERGGQANAQHAQAQADSAGDTVQIAVPRPRADAGRVDTFA